MTTTRDLRTVAPTIIVSTRRVRFSLAPLTVNDAPAPIGSTVLHAHGAADVARAVIGSEITECLLAIFLDARQSVTGYSEIARGTLNASRFTPRDVFIPALHANAAGVVVAAVTIAHNHPTGTPTPSRADRMATDALREAGRLIGLPLADHLIVTPDAVYSFRERDGWGD